MVIVIQYLLSFVIGFKILTTKGLNRFGWYLASLTLVNTLFNVYNGIALTQGHLFFVVLFFISLILEGRLNLKNLKRCPLAIPLFLLFLSYLLIGIFDTRISLAVGLYRGLYNFLQSFGAFLLGWLSIKDDVDLSGLSKKVMILSFVFTIYGIFTFIVKSNPIVDALGYQDRFVFENANASFRQFLVAGFLSESGVYGLSCFVVLMFMWALCKSRKPVYMLMIILLFVNIFLTATRSIMIPAIVGIIVFVMLYYNFKGKMAFILGGILVYAIISICFPNSIGKFTGEIIASIVDVISPSGSGGAELGGSNMDVRKAQISAAFIKYLPLKPLFGHGFNYYQEVIYAYNNGVNDSELYGMESYLCFLGVEYGLVNIIMVIVFFISLLRYFIKNKYVSRSLYSVSISVTVAYMLFLIFAYMGDSWLYVMPFLGLYVGMIEQRKRLFLS